MKERRLTSRCGAPGKLSELILSIWTEHHDTHRAERPFRISQQRRFASGPVTIDYAGRGRPICFPTFISPGGNTGERAKLPENPLPPPATNRHGKRQKRSAGLWSEELGEFPKISREDLCDERSLSH
jgi:hypothetical protein